MKKLLVMAVSVSGLLLCACGNTGELEKIIEEQNAQIVTLQDDADWYQTSSDDAYNRLKETKEELNELHKKYNQLEQENISLKKQLEGKSESKPETNQSEEELESYKLGPGKYIGGEDIPAGVYDLELDGFTSIVSNADCSIYIVLTSGQETYKGLEVVEGEELEIYSGSVDFNK